MLPWETRKRRRDCDASSIKEWGADLIWNTIDSKLQLSLTHFSLHATQFSFSIAPPCARWQDNGEPYIHGS